MAFYGQYLPFFPPAYSVAMAFSPFSRGLFLPSSAPSYFCKAARILRPLKTSPYWTDHYSAWTARPILKRQCQSVWPYRSSAQQKCSETLCTGERSFFDPFQWALVKQKSSSMTLATECSFVYFLHSEWTHYFESMWYEWLLLHVIHKKLLNRPLAHWFPARIQPVKGLKIGS